MFRGISCAIVYANCPQSATTTFFDVAPLWLPTASIAFTTSMPFVTLPNTQCFPFNHDVSAVHKKNCDPFVFGPALAMDKIPGPVCLSVKFSSSNLFP